MDLTQFFRPDQQGGYRIFGVPVAFGRGSQERILNLYETENPEIFVPKVVGVGWDINIGALAVKAGLLRPDDSLPDMRKYVDKATERFLAHAPKIGAALTVVSAIPVAKLAEAPTSWHLSGKPRNQRPGPVAALFPCLVSVSSAVISTRAMQRGQKQSPTGAELLTASSALGMQMMCMLSVQATRLSAARPNAVNPWPLLAVVSLPLSTVGIFVALVHTTLANINREMENHHE
ncbi:DUF5808 domain-containing protein [Corynebacterium aquilae]|uniref:DUF5808 domain-containing protein n=1 Tax=Corynebacterium aquilae TaxID=203263 RepID=UPI0009533157|nr:DUF5808 domain-containing protein [Corynebacterium aquilae]